MSRRPSQIIAVGGGKGGAGRSTIALTLARALAGRRRRVLLVDTDTTAPTLHIRLGLPPQAPPDGPGISDPDAPLSPFVRDTPTGVALLSLAFARNFPYVRPRLEAPALIDRLRDMRYDDVILDLPSGHDPVFVSLMVLSDLPIVVLDANAITLSVLTQNLRACIFHGLGFHPDCYDAEEELLLLLRDLPLNMNRNAMLPPYLSADGRRIVRDTCSQFSPNLILNRTRSDDDFPPTAALHALALAWYHLIGLYPRPLGHMPDDPTVASGLLADDSSPLARTARLMASTLEDPDDHMELYPRPITESHTPHGILGLDSSTPPAELYNLLSQTLALYRDRWRPLVQLLSRRDLTTLTDSLDRALTALLARHPELSSRIEEEEMLPDDPPHATPQPIAPTPTASSLQDTSSEEDAEPSSNPSTEEGEVSTEDDRAPSTTPERASSDASSADATSDTASPAKDTPDAKATSKATPDASSDDTKATPQASASAETDEAGDPKASPSEASSDNDDDDAADDDVSTDQDSDPSAAEDSSDSETQPTSDNEPAAVEAAVVQPEPRIKVRRSEPTYEPQPAEPPPDWPPDKPSPGAFISQVRRRQGVSMRELSLRTKIGLKYLQAIEDIDRRILPRPVYLRGYLREIAQAFDLNPAQLIDDYFAYLGYP
ncbi:MAG: helix-turn-helix domain-containing protein [Myxococcota bacterium]